MLPLTDYLNKKNKQTQTNKPKHTKKHPDPYTKQTKTDQCLTYLCSFDFELHVIFTIGFPISPLLPAVAVAPEHHLLAVVHQKWTTGWPGNQWTKMTCLWLWKTTLGRHGYENRVWNNVLFSKWHLIQLVNCTCKSFLTSYINNGICIVQLWPQNKHKTIVHEQ